MTTTMETPSAARIVKPEQFDRRVLAGLARGRSARSIAADLSSSTDKVAYQTVHQATAKLRHRYQARDSASLVKAAYGHGHLEGLPPEPRRQARVTERMRQVLRGIALGKTNAEIGRELYLVENTVKIHVRRMLRELDAVNRAHAVALDCQHHYSDQPGASR